MFRHRPSYRNIDSKNDQNNIFEHHYMFSCSSLSLFVYAFVQITKNSPIQLKIRQGNVEKQYSHNQKVRSIVNGVIYEGRTELGAKGEISSLSVRLHERQDQPGRGWISLKMCLKSDEYPMLTLTKTIINTLYMQMKQINKPPPQS